MFHFGHAYQKSVTHSQTMQNILTFFLSIFNLLEYSDNDSMKSETFWSYYIDEMNDDVNKSNDVSYIKMIIS